jgi:citrate synthase
MPAEAATSAKGLEGVVIAQTVKSKVDGQIGKLQYHGYNIKDLAEHASFEEVVYLLWYDKLPTQSELDEFEAGLAAERAIRPEIVDLLKSLPVGAHPMAVLRTAVSALGAFDPSAEDTSEDAVRAKGRGLLAAMPTIVAAWERIRNGKEPVEPRADLGHAANFLYMMTGEEPGETAVNAINTYLILLADHGMNASTFSARVTTSTLADVYSAITTALGTLKGPAHGGANQKAMEQFQEIGELGNVDSWFRKAREAGRRIMGIGHRVYKTQDPRAAVLLMRAEAMSATGDGGRWYEIARALDERARSDPYFIERSLYANVDYYSAVILQEAGIPVDQFTCVFAMSRVAGWMAHVMEQWADNRLIRPRAEYTGPVDSGRF